MDAGKLDRRVQFLRAEVMDDGYQRTLGPHSPHGTPVWAARRDMSDAERFAAGSMRAAVMTRFTVRWSGFTAGIRPTDRLACDGRTYEIIGLKETGSRRSFIEISAQAAA